MSAVQTPPAAPSRTHRAPVEGDPGRGSAPIAPSPGLPATCHYPGCTATATTEATWLQAWPSGDLFYGQWRPICPECALDDTQHQPDPASPFRTVGITLRPLAGA
ncbi:hypothetical protein [Ornithinimicrobium sufpigmenti]|uniref:hypothetical protein n=1 Tax=Ornithinimicrobium sufpigmenti TaxID=2508882 RepID=UPI0010360F63|nr:MULTISPECIES: hypothetical protein [unclassified Ornithinimicrobium]